MSEVYNKEILANHFGIPFVEDDWERVFRHKFIKNSILGMNRNETADVKVYRNKNTNDKCFILESPYSQPEIFEVDNWIYGLAYLDNDGEFTDMSNNIVVTFTTKSHFFRTGKVDKNLDLNVMSLLFDTDFASMLSHYVNDIDDDCDRLEGIQFPLDAEYLAFCMKMKKLNIQYDSELSDFMTSGTLNIRNIKPTNDLDYFPLIRNTTEVEDQDKKDNDLPIHISKAQDLVAVVYSDMDSVFVKIDPIRDIVLNLKANPIHADISSFIPSDWVETTPHVFTPGNLNIVETYDYLLDHNFQLEWQDIKDKMKISYDVYDVTLEIHNHNKDILARKAAPPTTVATVAHINPVASGPVNSTYPELTGQFTEVQEALELARSRGVYGLEQEGSRWIDIDDITANVARDFYESNDYMIELERSHVLWLMYEKYDVGAGVAFPNFFGMDDSRLTNEFIKILPFDAISYDEYLDEDYDDDGLHKILIVTDFKEYPSPYDLEVPEYEPNFTVPMSSASYNEEITLEKPFVAKKAVTHNVSVKNITGSGSFTSLSNTETNEKLIVYEIVKQMKEDAGEKPTEFSEELYNEFKTSGPGSYVWFNRFRPHQEMIIGLGFKFETKEFTGIKMKMGYVDRNLKFIEDIHLPDQLFDEMFPNGGEWNDKIVQFIYKQPGTNPDTGFSYSCNGMQEEIEQKLRGDGWYEVV